MKVLIVDDESLTRRGIRSMLKSSWGDVTEVQEAENAEEALAKIRETPFDILFVDIRMPGMNGLSFIETASAILPSATFILVSGYHEFEYTKRAIQLRVSDYLLKPIVKEELLGAFRKAVKERKRDNVRSAAVESSQLLNVLKEKVVIELIEGRKDAAARLSGTLLAELEHCRFACVSFRVQDTEEVVKEKGRSEITFIYYVMSNFMAELYGDELQGILFQHDDCLHVLLYSHAISKDVFAERVEDYVGRVLRWVARLKFFRVRCGISTPHEHLPGIRGSYREAVCALGYSIFTPDAVRTVYDPFMEREGLADYSFELEKELYNQVVLGNRAGIENAVSRLVDRTLASVRSAGALRRLLEMCWLLGERWLIESAVQSPLPISYGEFVTNPLYYDDLGHLKRELANHFHTVSLAINRQTGTDGRKAVGDMVEYIRNHYGEEISLAGLAEKLHMNAAYLSELFKEITGMGFVSYLTSVRMNKACEYLQHREIKIGQIASLVGFKDERYFSTVFKRMYGMTPGEYRRRWTEGNPGGCPEAEVNRDAVSSLRSGCV